MSPRSPGEISICIGDSPIRARSLVIDMGASAAPVMRRTRPYALPTTTRPSTINGNSRGRHIDCLGGTHAGLRFRLHVCRQMAWTRVRVTAELPSTVEIIPRSMSFRRVLLPGIGLTDGDICRRRLAGHSMYFWPKGAMSGLTSSLQDVSNLAETPLGF